MEVICSNMMWASLMTPKAFLVRLWHCRFLCKTGSLPRKHLFEQLEDMCRVVAGNNWRHKGIKGVQQNRQDWFYTHHSLYVWKRPCPLWWPSGAGLMIELAAVRSEHVNLGILVPPKGVVPVKGSFISTGWDTNVLPISRSSNVVN